jgi:hypothetical protein
MFKTFTVSKTLVEQGLMRGKVRVYGTKGEPLQEER